MYIWHSFQAVYGKMEWLLKLLAVGVILSGMPTASFAASDDSGLFSIFEPTNEREIGAQQHKKIVAQYGGEYVQEGLNDYILDIVLRIATVTEKRSEPWRVTVLNSPIVNAFALPGGYVYITRGLLALANNEAEVAGVLAHEVGHVVARHGAQRQGRATGVGLLGAIAGILTQSADVARLSQTMGGLLLANYSREQEYEADSLGIKYLGLAGYPREAAADFLERLADNAAYAKKLAGKDGEAGQFDFFASHPQTKNRIARARSIAVSQKDDLKRDYRCKAYLDHLNGMIYGDDIKEGVIKGRQFLHPQLRFAFSAPRGFQLINSKRAVLAQDRSGNQMTFDLDPRGLRGLSPADYMSRVWLAKIRTGTINPIQVGGAMGAVSRFTLTKGRQKTYMTMVVVNFGYDKVARFVYRSRVRQQELEAAYRDSYMSFRPMGYREAAKIRQTVLTVRKVGSDEDLSDLVSRMPQSKLKKDLFILLNPAFKKRAPQRGETYKTLAYASDIVH